jgi:hypothetical protein
MENGCELQMRISLCLTILVILGLGGASARADQFAMILRPNMPPPACTTASSAVECGSFAYLFNKQTTEFYRCKADLTVSVNAESHTLGNHSMSVVCEKLGQVPNIKRGNYSLVVDWRYVETPGKNAEAGIFFWISQDDKLDVRACVRLTHEFGTFSECSQATIR